MKDREFHSSSKTRMYRRWADMRYRCSYAKHPAYHNYGGRGITVCDRWQDSFINFVEDVGYPPFEAAQLDRVDNDGPYCKSNCRWITKKEQARNTRRNVLHTMDGVTKTRAEWCEEYKISPYTFRDRLRRGWDMLDALTRPPLPLGNNVFKRK